MIEETLLHDDGIKYNLMAWCIMPNHLHAVIEFIEHYCLEQVLQTWKSVSSHKANQLLLRKGSFWFREYYDRYIRNSSHLNDVIEYVENNPVKAGLVSSKELWRWNSAFYKR
jgi:putative transposase